MVLLLLLASLLITRPPAFADESKPEDAAVPATTVPATTVPATTVPATTVPATTTAEDAPFATPTIPLPAVPTAPATASATATPDGPAGSRGRQGIQGGWLVDDHGEISFAHGLMAQLPLIQTSGAGWVRVNFRLGGAYPNWTAPGTTGATALEAYDTVVDEARARGLKVLGLLSNDSWVGGQADWTAGNAEHGQGNGDNPYVRAFSQQAAVVLARHFQGRIDTWEVWNEPNLWVTNPRLGVFEGDTFLYPSNFAWLLRHVYEDTRAAGLTGLTFVAGGLAGSNFGGPGVPQHGDYRTASEGGVFLGVPGLPTPVPSPTPLPSPTATRPPAMATAARGTPSTVATAPATSTATATATATALPSSTATATVVPSAPPPSSGARYLRATYEQGLANAGWADVRRRLGSYPLDAVGQHLYLDQGAMATYATLRTYLADVRAAYAAFEGPSTPKHTMVTEFGWTSPGVSPAVQSANLQSAYAVFRALPYVGPAFWFSAQDVPEGGVYYGLQTGGAPEDSYSGTPKPALRAYQSAAAGMLAPSGPAAGAAGTVQILGGHAWIRRLRQSAVPFLALRGGTVTHVPAPTCPRNWAYRAYLRVDELGAGGFGGLRDMTDRTWPTFGIRQDGLLEWIAPEDAGCIDWTPVDDVLTVPRERIAGVLAERPQPGTLLWVIDGDEFWRGRLYEVTAGGQAHFITAAYGVAHRARYQDLWRRIVPVRWSQVYDLALRGLVGADL